MDDSVSDKSWFPGSISEWGLLKALLLVVFIVTCIASSKYWLALLAAIPTIYYLYVGVRGWRDRQ